jgi:hypothetical protein
MPPLGPADLSAQSLIQPLQQSAGAIPASSSSLSTSVNNQRLPSEPQPTSNATAPPTPITAAAQTSLPEMTASTTSEVSYQPPLTASTSATETLSGTKHALDTTTSPSAITSNDGAELAPLTKKLQLDPKDKSDNEGAQQPLAAQPETKEDVEMPDATPSSLHEAPSPQQNATKQPDLVSLTAPSPVPVTGVIIPPSVTVDPNPDRAEIDPASYKAVPPFVIPTVTPAASASATASIPSDTLDQSSAQAALQSLPPVLEPVSLLTPTKALQVVEQRLGVRGMDFVQPVPVSASATSAITDLTKDRAIPAESTTTKTPTVASDQPQPAVTDTGTRSLPSLSSASSIPDQLGFLVSSNDIHTNSNVPTDQGIRAVLGGAMNAGDQQLTGEKAPVDASVDGTILPSIDKQLLDDLKGVMGLGLPNQGSAGFQMDATSQLAQVPSQAQVQPPQRQVLQAVMDASGSDAMMNVDDLLNGLDNDFGNGAFNLQPQQQNTAAGDIGMMMLDTVGAQEGNPTDVDTRMLQGLEGLEGMDSMYGMDGNGAATNLGDTMFNEMEGEDDAGEDEDDEEYVPEDEGDEGEDDEEEEDEGVDGDGEYVEGE